MGLDNYRDLIDDLATYPPILREAVAAFGAAPEGEWGAAEIVAHLTATEEFFSQRIMRLLSERQPHLQSFAQAAEARMTELLNDSIDDNLERFGELRGQTVSSLMSMTLGDWERTGDHPTFGEISITDTVEMISDHDAEHLAQLRG
jgi:hypothetical protein